MSDDVKDELYYEVLVYTQRYKDCSAADILRILGEMRAFWYKMMKPEDLEAYEKFRREVLDRPASEIFPDLNQ